MPQSTYRITTDQGTFDVTVEHPPEGTAFAPEPPASALSRFGSELYAKSPLPAVVGAVTGTAHVIAHPLDTYFGVKPLAETVKNMAKAQWDQAVQAAQKAKEATSGGGVLSASEALGHGLAAVLPILGPAAADVGEHFAKGDLAGGAGGATSLLAPFALKYGLELKNAPNPGKADLLRREAEQQVSQNVLAPANPKFKGVAERIAPEVLNRNLQGNRLQLQQIADEGMATAAEAIDTAVDVKGRTAPVSTAPIVKALDDRIQDYQVGGTVIPTAAGRVKQLEGLRAYLAQHPSLPFDQLKKVRDEFYATADAAKGYQGPDINVPDVAWAAREAGSAIRQAIAADRPELVGPNADFTFFKRLGDVLDPSLGRPKNMVAAPSGITGGQSTAGAVVGAAAGMSSHIPGASGALALLGSRLLPALLEARKSPAWQLASAAKKMAIASAIEQGQIGPATNMLFTIAHAAPRTQTAEQP